MEGDFYFIFIYYYLVYISLCVCVRYLLMLCVFPPPGQVLLEAFSRCVAVLTASSKPGDMSVQVNPAAARR